MRRTSISTYRAIQESGALSAKRMAVYEHLFKHGPLTGSQLQVALRSKGSVSESIRNRVTELVKMGVVYEVKETKCPITGRNVLLFDVTENMPKEYEKPKSKNEIIKELREENEKLKFGNVSKETFDSLIEKYPSGLVSLKILRRELYGK